MGELGQLAHTLRLMKKAARHSRVVYVVPLAGLAAGGIVDLAGSRTGLSAAVAALVAGILLAALLSDSDRDTAAGADGP